MGGSSNCLAGSESVDGGVRCTKQPMSHMWEKCDWREEREKERVKERERELVRGSENSAQAFPVFPCSSVREGQERGERESNEGRERVNESQTCRLEELIHIRSLYEWMNRTK